MFMVSEKIIMILLNIMFKIENHGVYLLVVKVRRAAKKSSSSSHHQSSSPFLGTNLDTDANLYGTHPFYLVMEQIQNTNQAPSGHMHGILLLNSNAMDYTFDKSPSLTIRTIGGVLDFFFSSVQHLNTLSSSTHGSLVAQ